MSTYTFAHSTVEPHIEVYMAEKPYTVVALVPLIPRNDENIAKAEEIAAVITAALNKGAA